MGRALWRWFDMASAPNAIGMRRTHCAAFQLEENPVTETPQTYDNHTRWHPPFHFFLMPLFLLNFIFAAVQLFRFRDLDHAAWLVLAVGLLALTGLARINALRVQDRLIRLEERLRYQTVLPLTLAQSAGALPTGQIVALRFASDEELPELVQQVLDGKLTKGDEIKRAVRRWRADTLRV
ncbi:MAG TPA: DUF6526 family protein [Pyrinomonadaceae bacterium]|nr:DUF6526 family protein [Pyrinomonadaceae bacterium]